jgi:hypothetical protein
MRTPGAAQPEPAPQPRPWAIPSITFQFVFNRIIKYMGDDKSNHGNIGGNYIGDNSFGNNTKIESNSEKAKKLSLWVSLIIVLAGLLLGATGHLTAAQIRSLLPFWIGEAGSPVEHQFK